MEYAFLADFDLLRDTRQDVRTQTWATPAGRLAMDQHFKLLRAEEEIQRLNIEIPRVITYIGDKAAFFKTKEEEMRSRNPALAHQIEIHCQERGRFNKVHAKCFLALSRLCGFTGSIQPGKHANPPTTNLPSLADATTPAPILTPTIPVEPISQLSLSAASGEHRAENAFSCPEEDKDDDNEEDEDEDGDDDRADNDDSKCLEARISLLELSQDKAPLS